MKAEYILLVTLSVCACTGGNTENRPESEPAAEVTLVQASYGRIPQETVFMAAVSYLSKTSVSAPVSSFVRDAAVMPGSAVKKGSLLYVLESKEQHALGDGSRPILIKSGCDGIVTDVPARPGSYQPEGSVLCTIADTGSLVFEINMPYAQNKFAREGTECILELPDGSCFRAEVRTTLVTMDTSSQSEKVLAVADGVPVLPEGLDVKAVFVSEPSSGPAAILPKSAVQSDETLSEYWIMLLSGDSTAVKVPVKVGGSTADSIEILSPEIRRNDFIIQTGGYGLQGGEKVTVSR